MNDPIQSSTISPVRQSRRLNTNRKYSNHITPIELQRNIKLEEDKLNRKDIKSYNISDKETERKINKETEEGKTIINKTIKESPIFF